MVTEQKRRCKLCGNQMYKTRFQTTDRGTDPESAYECLWCEETESLSFNIRRSQPEELVA